MKSEAIGGSALVLGLAAVGIGAFGGHIKGLSQAARAFLLGGGAFTLIAGGAGLLNSKKVDDHLESKRWKCFQKGPKPELTLPTRLSHVGPAVIVREEQPVGPEKLLGFATAQKGNEVSAIADQLLQMYDHNYDAVIRDLQRVIDFSITVNTEEAEAIDLLQQVKAHLEEL